MKKRRLADAAKQLLYTDRRIIDIALERGFESSEAFSRSFKALYRVSPALYRKNRLDLFIGSKPRLDAGGRLEHLTQNVTVHPTIVELPDIKVIGLRGQTTLHDNVLPDLWARFNQISHTIDNAVADARGFGICEACTGWQIPFPTSGVPGLPPPGSSSISEKISNFMTTRFLGYDHPQSKIDLCIPLR